MSHAARPAQQSTGRCYIHGETGAKHVLGNTDRLTCCADSTSSKRRSMQAVTPEPSRISPPGRPACPG
eukprot:6897080-Alexandrium_andersonii.AAC.1